MEYNPMRLPGRAERQAFEEEVRDFIGFHHNLERVMSLVMRAYDYTVKGHGADLRGDGTYYVYHPISVALIAMHYGITDYKLIILCLMHDLREDTNILSFSTMWHIFGNYIAEAQDVLTKREGNLSEGIAKETAEENAMRLLAFACWRPALGKLIDRFHNLDTLEGLEYEKALEYLVETETVFLIEGGLVDGVYDKVLADTLVHPDLVYVLSIIEDLRWQFERLCAHWSIMLRYEQ